MCQVDRSKFGLEANLWKGVHREEPLTLTPHSNAVSTDLHTAIFVWRKPHVDCWVAFMVHLHKCGSETKAPSRVQQIQAPLRRQRRLPSQNHAPKALYRELKPL